MRMILPGRLWIAPAADVNSLREFINARGRAVLQLASEEPIGNMPRELIVARFPLIDGGGNDPEVLEAAVSILVQLMNSEIPTLVTCSAGMSRSPCIVAAAVAVSQNRPFEECLSEVTAAGPSDVSPPFSNDIASIVADFSANLS